MSLLFLGLVVFLLLVVVGRFSKADPNRAARVVRGARRSFMAYFDRGHARRREDPQRDAAPGQDRNGAAAGGEMTKEEAYQILGLQPGAGADDITRAHRAFMKKLHPDQGGSTYLAARVNQAKDVLLRRHR
jgi:DnaJ-domain-containing protein 1